MILAVNARWTKSASNPIKSLWKNTGNLQGKSFEVTRRIGRFSVLRIYALTSPLSITINSSLPSCFVSHLSMSRSKDQHDYYMKSTTHSVTIHKIPDIMSAYSNNFSSARTSWNRSWKPLFNLEQIVYKMKGKSATDSVAIEAVKAFYLTFKNWGCRWFLSPA